MGNLPMKPHIQRLAILKANDAISNQEIADIIGKSIRYVQLILAEADKDFSADEIRKISNYLSDRGRNDLARCFFSAAWTLESAGEASSDGNIDDEIADMVEVLGSFKHSYRDRVIPDLDNMISEASKIIRRMQAEADRLR